MEEFSAGEDRRSRVADLGGGARRIREEDNVDLGEGKELVKEDGAEVRLELAGATAAPAILRLPERVGGGRTGAEERSAGGGGVPENEGEEKTGRAIMEKT